MILLNSLWETKVAYSYSQYGVNCHLADEEILDEQKNKQYLD